MVVAAVLLFFRLPLNDPVLLVMVVLIVINAAGIVLLFRFLKSQNRKLHTAKLEAEEKYQSLSEEIQKANNAEETVETEQQISENAGFILNRLKDCREKEAYFDQFLVSISKVKEIVQGLVYIKENDIFIPAGKYAFPEDTVPEEITMGSGVSGQTAENMKPLVLSDIPENYLSVISGTGNGAPNNLLIYPVVDKDKTIAIIELAMFHAIREDFIRLLDKVSVKAVHNAKKIKSTA